MGKSVIINVNPSVWEWVRSTARLSGDLCDKLNQWQNGEKAPTFNQLEDFSCKTRIPFGYFLMSAPPEEKCAILEYRTVDSQAVTSPSRDLIDVVHRMEDIQEWIREYRVSEGFDGLAFVGSLDKTMAAGSVANRIRSVLSLGFEWYRHVDDARESFNLIRERISSSGVTVMMDGTVSGNTHRPMNIDEFRAFAIVDGYAPLILY